MSTRRNGWLALSLAVIVIASSLSRAGDVTWNNGSTDFTWNTTSVNWTGVAWKNGNYDGAIFGATGIGTVSVPGPINVRSISLTSSGYTLSGAGSINFSTAGTSTLASPTLSASTGTTNINAALVSPFGLNVLGAGAINLTGSGHSLSGLVTSGAFGEASNLQVGNPTSTSGGGNLNIGATSVLPTSTSVGLGSGVIDIGANNTTISQLVVSNINGSAGTNGVFKGTGGGILTVTGEIRVIGNGSGFGNQISANMNIPSGTQIVRVGSGSNGARELVFNNVISGGGGFSKTYYNSTSTFANSQGGFSLTGNNTYTGPTMISGGSSNSVTGTNTSTSLTVAGGTLSVFGASGSYGSATSVTLNSGGTLVLDNVASQSGTGSPTIAAGNLNNRIATTANLNMQGGLFQITGATGASNQTLADLNMQSGFSTVTLSPGTTSVLSATGNLNITSGATVLFRSSTLPDTTAVAQATTAFTVAGTTPATVGNLIVGAVGAASTSGTGTDFVRYISANNVGIARLAAAEYTTNYTTPNANVSVTGTQTVAASIAVNSIKSGAFTTTINDSQSVTVTSGMILATGATVFSPQAVPVTPGTLAFGGNRAYMFTAGGNITVNVPITGSAGLTKASVGNTLALNGDNVGLTGGIVVQGGTLQFNSTASTNFSGTLDILQGTATPLSGVVYNNTSAVNLGYSTTPDQANVTSAVLNLGNLATATNFTNAINTLGNGSGGAQVGGLQVTTPASGTFTLSGPISLGNNLTITGAETTLSITGAITGNAGLYLGSTSGTTNMSNSGNTFSGTLYKTGASTLNLSGSTGVRKGGTNIQSGIVQFDNAANLGSGTLTLLGGTLQSTAVGAVTLTNATYVGASAAINTGSQNFTFSGALNGLSGQTITKSGTGAMVVTAAGGYQGGISLGTGAGALTLNGNGALPQLGAVSIGNAGTLNIDNSVTNLANRTGATTNLTLTNGGVAGTSPMVNLTTNAAGSTFNFGTLTVSGGVLANPNNSTFNIIDGGAGTNSINFLSLAGIGANNTLNLVGTTNFGLDVAGAATRMFFTTAPTLSSGVIPGVSFTGFGGSGPATYDPVLGVIRFNQTIGSFIDNINAVGPGSITPTGANFVTNAATTANLGATIKTLTIAGNVVTLVPSTYAPQAGNANAPTDTLVISNGVITANTGAGSQFSSATPARVQFGSAGATQANITVTQNLLVDANVTLATTGGLLMSGAAALTVNGTNSITGDYNVTGGTLNLNTGGSLASYTSTAGTTMNLATTTQLNGTSGNTFTSLGAIAGAGALQTTAGFTNVQVLSRSSGAYTGAITINGGTLVAANAAAFGPNTNAATIVNSGGTMGLQGSITYTGPGITLNGVGATGRSGAIDNISGSNSYAGAINLATNATIGSTTGTLTLSGGFTGGGTPTFNTATGSGVTLTTVALNIGANTLQKTGGGTLILPNLNNTMAGQNVTGGVVQASADLNLGANTSTMTLNGGGLQYGAAFNIDPARPVVLGASGGTINTNSFSPAQFGTVMTGAGSLTKAGTGTLTFTAAQNYGGATTITNGTLTSTVNNGVPTGSALTIGDVTNAGTNSPGTFTIGAGLSQTLNANLSAVAGNRTFLSLGIGSTLFLNGNFSYVDVNSPNNGNASAGMVSGGTIDLGGVVRNFNTLLRTTPVQISRSVP